MNLMQAFRLKVPIFQAPMAGVQNSALAIEVCNAGGLGALPSAMLGAQDLSRELSAIRAATTAPFNANFFCHAPPAADPDRDRGWLALLAPYYAEASADVTKVPGDAGRTPFSAETADALAPFAPAVVSFHFGLPSAELVARVKSWGSKVVSSATTVDEARWLEAHGADAIIAQGLEAGGHRGLFLTEDLTTQLGTFALLPQVAKAVHVPVIAAGGIADAAGVRAALALGASAVQIGTSYLLCPEATTGPLHRAALKSASASHTAVTNVFTGRPARSIVNRLVRELGPINADAPAFPLAYNALAPLRAKAEAEGRSDFSPFWCGQNTSGCKEVPAGHLTRELAGLG